MRRINGSDNFSEPIWLIEVDGYRMPNDYVTEDRIWNNLDSRDISSCVKINTNGTLVS